MSQLKRIGFVDYRLENYHANVFLKAIRNELKLRNFEVAGCLGLDEEIGRKWAQANNVPYFTDPAALSRVADYFMVLAPSNPEVHLELCRKMFPFGKPTYVDKTFAPNLQTAKQIFALADEHRVAVQTTSALRYTAVQQYVQTTGPQNVRHMVAWGSGRSFEEYAIHPLELVISCMGEQVLSMLRRGTGTESQVLLNFTDARTAVVNVYIGSKSPFAASVTTPSETCHVSVDGSRLFIDTADAILNFFETAVPNIPRQQSLMIRRILDLSADPKSLGGFVNV